MKMNTKKMLVLGSDFFTYQIVKEAKEMGIYVIVTDLMKTSPTKELADEKWFISTADLDQLENACKENNVTAVMYGASDFNVSKARLLCKRLGLPIYCDNELAWNVSRDKRLFKDYCKKIGAPVADDYYVSDELSDHELSKIKYPVVVKPVDLSGNRGMSYCNSDEELRIAYKYARSMSDNSKIIIEKKLRGTEHHVNYVAGNGMIQLASFGQAHHMSNQLANVYSFEHTSSLHLKEYLEQANEPLIQVFKELGVREGIVWADTIFDEDEKQFYILEMGYRFPAAVASCSLYERVSGFDPVKWMIECSLGIEHKKEAFPRKLDCAYKNLVGLAHLFTDHEGTIGSITGLEKILANKNINVDMPKTVGDSVRDHACMALISIYGDDCEDVIDSLMQINNELKILDDHGNDLVILFDEYDSIREAYYGGLRAFGEREEA